MERFRTIVMPSILLMFLALTLVPASSGGGEEDRRFLYQWTDEQGSVHISDGIEKVPRQYRNRATRIEQGTAGSAEPPQPEPERGSQEQGGFGFTLDDASAQNDEDRKIEWQQRMYDARQRMADAEERIQNSGERLKALQEKTGYGLYGYTPEAAAEASRLEEELARAQSDLEEARNQVENVIPEEARKAGIPPGWLRETR